MTFAVSNEWESGFGGTALMDPPAEGDQAEHDAESENPGWATTIVAGVDDDLDEDESYFLEADDDDDDDDYDEDEGDDFDDDDDDEEVEVEADDDDDDDL